MKRKYEVKTDGKGNIGVYIDGRKISLDEARESGDEVLLKTIEASQKQSSRGFRGENTFEVESW